MKKVYMGLICSLLFVSMVGAANIAVWYGTESSPQTYINSSGVMYAPSFVGAMTISDATISGNATVSGAITGATLRVTGNSVLSGTATVGSTLIAQTNATVAGTLGVTGVATFTAESVHNLGIDADYITTDAGAGIDTKEAGELKIGVATADTIAYGGAGVSSHTFTTTAGGDAAIVLPLLSIGNGEIAADVAVGKLAIATGKVIIGNASGLGAAQTLSGITVDTNGLMTIGAGQVTNSMLTAGIDAAKIQDEALVKTTTLAGDVGGVWDSLVIGAGAVHASMIDPAIVTNVLSGGMALPAVDGNAVTNLNGANFGSSMTAANLTAGTIATAIDGSAITNISISAANLTAGSTASAFDGGAVTNVTAIAMSADGLMAATVASAIDISACTNLPTTGIVGGWSGVVTNNGIDTTNTLTFANGVLTTVVSNP